MINYIKNKKEVNSDRKKDCTHRPQPVRPLDYRGFVEKSFSNKKIIIIFLWSIMLDILILSISLFSYLCNNNIICDRGVGIEQV